MIQVISDVNEVRDFVLAFQGDPSFGDPKFSDGNLFWENLERAFARPATHPVLGVYEGGVLTGLFVLLVLPEESYVEVLTALSREEDAYEEILAHISRLYPGYHVDFVYNPNNYLLTARLKARGAEFDPVQKKMLYTGNSPACESTAVVPYSAEFREGYVRIHDDSDGRYWTAEKVLAAPDRFRTYLALHGGRVVGFIDVTHCFDENEPYDLFVCPEYRRMGLGRALLARALAENGERAMMLLVDEDNIPAIRLYESMGFVTDEAGANQTASLTI